MMMALLIPLRVKHRRQNVKSCHSDQGRTSGQLIAILLIDPPASVLCLSGLKKNRQARESVSEKIALCLCPSTELETVPF